MGFFIDDTRGWSEKTWLGIGRAYDMMGDLDTIHVDLFVIRIGWWFK